MTPTTPRSAAFPSSTQCFLKSLTVCLSTASALWLTGCAASGGGGGNANSPEFQAAANQIVSRISNSGATLNYVNASNTGVAKVSTVGSKRSYYSGVGISGGVLSLTETLQTNERQTYPTFVKNDSSAVTTVSRIPLAKVTSLSINQGEGMFLGGSSLTVSQTGLGRTASMRTKTFYRLSLTASGMSDISSAVTHTGTNFQGVPFSTTERKKVGYATVGTFDSKEQAAAFAREFGAMVAKLTGKPAPEATNF